ncbi:MAG: hypothetical protein ACYDCN_09155 [Bacteroidia bacterium]
MTNKKTVKKPRKKKLPKAAKGNKPMDFKTMLKNDIQTPII